MRLLTGLKLMALLASVAAVPLAVQGGKASAQAKPQAPPTTTQITYSYSAQPGDSYTQLARKAAQTYGKKFNAKLSPAKIIFVETNMMRAANAPRLEVSQKVDIAEAVVKHWADKAAALSPAEEAAWAQYVPSVDFNTDHVGQAH